MLIDFREKGREGDRERNIGVRENGPWVASCMRHPTGPNRSPGLCPDQEWSP